jgi:hypothetical protein
LENLPCVFPSWEKANGRYAVGYLERLPVFFWFRRFVSESMDFDG